MKLCSACLLGINCKYDGKNNLDKAPKELLKEFKKGNLIPICPEQLGGLPTPREKARIRGGDGYDVLKKKAQVITESKKDVTKEFLRGAKEVLKIAKKLKIKEAILKQRSPSCGCGQIYKAIFDKKGNFLDKIIKGDGVTSALLKQNGIKVKTEEDLFKGLGYWS